MVGTLHYIVVAGVQILETSLIFLKKIVYFKGKKKCLFYAEEADYLSNYSYFSWFQSIKTIHHSIQYPTESLHINIMDPTKTNITPHNHVHGSIKFV